MQSTRDSCPIFMIIEYTRHIFFEKYSNIKIHENPSGGYLVVPCGQTEGRTDMMKLIVAFRSFAEAPQNAKHCTISRAKQILFISHLFNTHFNNILLPRTTHLKPLRFF